MIYISNIIQCIFLSEVHISMTILDTKNGWNTEKVMPVESYKCLAFLHLTWDFPPTAPLAFGTRQPRQCGYSVLVLETKLQAWPPPTRFQKHTFLYSLGCKNVSWLVKYSLQVNWVEKQSQSNSDFICQ